jgi:hypothetical protein
VIIDIEKLTQTINRFEIMKYEMKRIILAFEMIFGMVTIYSANLDWKIYQNQVLNYQANLEDWSSPEKSSRILY